MLSVGPRTHRLSPPQNVRLKAERPLFRLSTLLTTLPERAHKQGLMGTGVRSFKRYSLTGPWQTAGSRGSLTSTEDQGWRTVVARLKGISGVQARAGGR